MERLRLSPALLAISTQALKVGKVIFRGILTVIGGIWIVPRGKMFSTPDLNSATFTWFDACIVAVILIMVYLITRRPPCP